MNRLDNAPADNAAAEVAAALAQSIIGSASQPGGSSVKRHAILAHGFVELAISLADEPHSLDCEALGDLATTFVELAEDADNCKTGADKRLATTGLAMVCWLLETEV